MRILNKSILIVLTLLAVLLNCNLAMAQPDAPVPLFIEIGDIHPRDPLPPDVATLRTRYVRLNTVLLFDPYGNVKNIPVHTKILFNLFPNVNLVGHITEKGLEVSETEDIPRIAEWTGKKGISEWHGYIEGIAKGHFAIMLHNPPLPFQVYTPVYSYYIKAIGHDNLYRVTEVDQHVLDQMG